MTELAKLEQAERMLAEIATVQDAVKLKDVAEAARVYAKQMKLGTSAANHATAIKLKAEIRLAQLVDEGQKQGTIAAHGGHKPKQERSDSEPSRPQTLSELGIQNRRVVSEARTIARYHGTDDIDKMVTEANAQGKEIKRSEVLEKAKSEQSYDDRGLPRFTNEELNETGQELKDAEDRMVRFAWELDVDKGMYYRDLTRVFDKFKELMKRAEPDQREEMIQTTQQVLTNWQTWLEKDLLSW